VNVSNVIASKDTVPPTVSITSPAGGATVSGTVSITASATDNVGVSSVQFKIDGNNLGSAVTTSPYSASWATTGVTNGTHTISAVASDAAGNTSTATDTVTVSNSTTQLVASTLWIYQNSLASTWSDGSWGATANFGNTSPVYSGCTASISVNQNASGALRLLSGGWNALVPVDPSQYTDVSFDIYSQSKVQLQVFLMGGPSGVTFPTVGYGTLKANRWNSVSIPFSSLDPSNQTFTMLVIEDGSGNAITYYVDNLNFTGFPSPTLLSPANGASGVALPVTLSWNALPAGVSCRVQVSSNQNFSPVLLDTTLSADTSVTPGDCRQALHITGGQMPLHPVKRASGRRYGASQHRLRRLRPPES